MFKGDLSFYERNKLLQKHKLWMKEKFILKRNENFKFWVFLINQKMILRISGSKRRSLSAQEDAREMIFP